MANRLDRIQNWPALAKKAEYDTRKLAKLCAVSVRHLERFTKKKFRSTPHGWLRSVRMVEAESLLREGLSAKSAALTLGYKQPSHFSRQFKKHAGIPPTAFATRLIAFDSEPAARAN